MSTSFEDEKNKKKKEEEETIEAPLPLFNDEPQGPPREELSSEPVETVTPPPASEVPPITEGINNEDVQKVVQAKADTAEDIYKTRVGLAEGEKQATEDYIEGMKNLHESRKATYDANTRAQAERNQQYLEDIKTLNQEQRNLNQDILNRYIKEAEDARKEHEAATKAETRTILGTGLAEVGLALANLIGVAKGAENQNIHLFSEDWMRRSEQNRKERIHNLNSLNERRRELEQQMAVLRASQGRELAQLALKNDSYQRERDSAWEDRELNFNAQMLGLKRGVESGYNTAIGEAEIERTSSTGEAKASGLASNVGSSKSAKSSGGGSGSGKPSGYDEDGIPVVATPQKGWFPLDIGGKHYWFTPASLKETLEAHQDEFDISQEELAGKPLNERLAYLKSKINENPKAQAALRNASFGRVPSGRKEAINTPKGNIDDEFK